MRGLAPHRGPVTLKKRVYGVPEVPQMKTRCSRGAGGAAPDMPRGNTKSLAMAPPGFALPAQLNGTVQG